MSLANLEKQQEILNKLSPEERKIALSILKEYSEQGNSALLDSIIDNDYSEVPVDISTFLHDKKYLGNALYDTEGRFTLYPYWEETLKKIFPDNVTTAYNTLILTGAIGLGKSTVAVICLLYLLYRLLCLKDPYLYYGMQPIDKISISLMNINLDNAKGVAQDKMNQMILSSEWFMAHGEMHGTTNLEYVPEKHIEIITASSNNQIIGRCLDGETKILTSTGSKKLKDLVNKTINVMSIGANGSKWVSNKCTVIPTAIEQEEYQIKLADDTIIKCTSNHKFMLRDGSYKEAQCLYKGDEIFYTMHAYYEDNRVIKIKSIKKVMLKEHKQFYDVINAYPYNNFLIDTNKGYICSHNCLLANFTDEVNFSAMTTDVERAKRKQKTLIAQIDARMKSRFMRDRGGETFLPTLNIIASSKDSEQSFLEDFIDGKKKSESKTTLIVDEPQWVVDTRKDSKIKFYVAIGNKMLANELLPVDASKELVDEYRAKGYSMLAVPIGYYENFQENIDEAICSIAGISTSSSFKFISGARWNDIKTARYENPFRQEVIQVGINDNMQYGQFFDLTKVPLEYKSKPLYIHLDMSKSGDNTGIAGVWVTGKKPKIEGEQSSKEMFYRVAFSVGIKAPKGSEISFDKNRAFIRWLREQGFNIKCVSADTFQSTQIQQQLKADGFTVKTTSVDVVDKSTKQCLTYGYFKSTIYDKRLEVYKDCDLLTEEVINLERESSGKINHPDNGTKGSKDIADAVCGSIWDAAQDADEFAYNYGEQVQSSIEFNSENLIDERQQFIVDMEQELAKMNPLTNNQFFKEQQEKEKASISHYDDFCIM